MNKKYKYLTFLSTLYTTILLSSILLDYKFISFGSVIASSATFIVSLTFLIGAVITEVYGFQECKKIILSNILCLFLFSSIMLFFSYLSTPESHADYGSAYQIILTLLYRAGISNAIAIAFGSFFNIYFLSKWKYLVKGKIFWIRSLGSSAVGESIYTIFIVSMINIGIVSFKEYFEILAISYFYKIAFNTLSVFPAAILANFLKKNENVDIYDFPDYLTPFKYKK